MFGSVILALTAVAVALYVAGEPSSAACSSGRNTVHPGECTCPAHSPSGTALSAAEVGERDFATFDGFIKRHILPEVVGTGAKREQALEEFRQDLHEYVLSVNQGRIPPRLAGGIFKMRLAQFRQRVAKECAKAQSK